METGRKTLAKVIEIEAKKHHRSLSAYDNGRKVMLCADYPILIALSDEWAALVMMQMPVAEVSDRRPVSEILTASRLRHDHQVDDVRREVDALYDKEEEHFDQLEAQTRRDMIADLVPAMEGRITIDMGRGS